MKVELMGYFGSDFDICNVARVSYAKDASNFSEEQNAKLIKYLVEHGHTSPMRHSTLQFRIKCPIYVERQLHKHQIGVSVNSVSGRYVDFSDSYYEIPFGEWRKQSKSSKQGSEGFLDEESQKLADSVQWHVIETCQKAYNELLDLGVSKEQARSILPLALETEFIWTGSFLAFMHMCNLRLKEDTQKETSLVVKEMLKQVEEIQNKPFYESLKAFGYGKVN